MFPTGIRPDGIGISETGFVALTGIGLTHLISKGRMDLRCRILGLFFIAVAVTFIFFFLHVECDLTVCDCKVG